MFFVVGMIAEQNSHSHGNSTRGRAEMVNLIDSADLLYVSIEEVEHPSMGNISNHAL
jgi:hypothetical protein